MNSNHKTTKQRQNSKDKKILNQVYSKKGDISMNRKKMNFPIIQESKNIAKKKVTINFFYLTLYPIIYILLNLISEKVYSYELFKSVFNDLDFSTIIDILCKFFPIIKEIVFYILFINELNNWKKTLDEIISGKKTNTYN